MACSHTLDGHRPPPISILPSHEFFSLLFWPQLVYLHMSEELSGSVHPSGSRGMRLGMKAVLMAGVRVGVFDRRDACRHLMQSSYEGGHSAVLGGSRLTRECYSFQYSLSFGGRLHIYN